MLNIKFKGILLALFLVLFLFIQLERTPSLRAQTQQSSLSVTPGTLVLAPNEQGQAIILARFAEAGAQNARLEFFAEPAVMVEVEQAERAGVLRGDVVWRAKITRAANGRSSGKVVFVVHYTAPDARNETTTHVLTTALEIQERAPASLDTILDAKLETALDNIQDQKRRTVFVILTNKSTVPVTVTQIIAQDIAHFTLTPQDVGKGVTLQPQETRPFTVTVTALDQVEIGKQLLVVQTDATWEKDGQRVNGSLVLSKEFQVGVFGEQEILAATAIPSFLLLPGFLFVITGLLLLKWSWKKEPIPLNLKEPQFWIFAITLSLLIVIVYPIVSGALLSWYYQRAVAGRNLLQGYGFTDILYLWLGVIVLAILLWAVLSALALTIRGIVTWLRQRHAREHFAATNDTPLNVLHKLANNRLGFALEQVEFKRDGKTQIIFTLPRELGAPDGKRWLVPAAQVNIQGDGARERKQRFSEQLVKYDDARGMENLLRTWGKEIVSVDWEKGGVDTLVQQPLLVETKETQESGNQQPFLSE